MCLIVVHNVVFVFLEFFSLNELNPFDSMECIQMILSKLYWLMYTQKSTPIDKLPNSIVFVL